MSLKNSELPTEAVCEEKHDPFTMRDGATAIFKKGEVYKAMKISSSKQIVFEKLRFRMDAVVGSKFGSFYKVVNNSLVKVSSKEVAQLNSGVTTESGVDNRSLKDSHGDSQSMDREEIVKMKESGADGSAIIDTLVKNSSSFSQKTAYSQNKYLKKKQKKHCAIIQILRPTSRLIFQMYEKREPGKICQMQASSLSQLLTMANIRSGSRVVIVENFSGVVLGAVLERLAGSGACVNIHAGGETAPNLFSISHLNLPDEHWAVLHSLPLHTLTPALACTTPEQVEQVIGADEDMDEEQKAGGEIEQKEPTRKRKLGKMRDLTREQRMELRFERRAKRKAHQTAAIDLLRARDMDCLIVACKMHPTPIVAKLLEVLAPSRPFAVYCEHREPLMELFVNLSMSGRAINLQLTDTFMRYYQVLPERTHPHVQMAGNGGYVLSGIKVLNGNEEK